MTGPGELDDAVSAELPLRGEWVAHNSPADRIPSHGTDLLAQRFAFDFGRLDPETWKRVSPAGRWRSFLLGVRTRDCYGWGQPIHAALAGEVVVAHGDTGERDRIVPLRDLPAAIWTGITYRPEKGFAAVAGNHVIIRSDEIFTAYAHLAPGSLKVRIGDHVEAGELLGSVGHTGNSTVPHLHFQAMDGPDPVTARAIPVRFRAYEVLRDGTWQRVEDEVPGRADRIRSVA